MTSSSPMPVVRRGTPGDAAEFLRLRTLIFDAWPFPVDTESDPTWPERFVATYRELLADDDFAALVVDDPAETGRLAGCLSVAVTQHLPIPGAAGRVAYVADMCTDPAHRGRGIGRAMLEAARGWAVERGATRIHLYATDAGRPLYEADGFSAQSPFAHMGRALP